MSQYCCYCRVPRKVGYCFSGILQCVCLYMGVPVCLCSKTENCWSDIDEGIYVMMPLNQWQTNDKIGQFYHPILSVKLEPSSTAEFIADKICRFYWSHVIQKSADFCGPVKAADFIVNLSQALEMITFCWHLILTLNPEQFY